MGRAARKDEEQEERRKWILETKGIGVDSKLSLVSTI
jgi:hypothetical protein